MGQTLASDVACMMMPTHDHYGDCTLWPPTKCLGQRPIWYPATSPPTTWPRRVGTIYITWPKGVKSAEHHIAMFNQTQPERVEFYPIAPPNKVEPTPTTWPNMVKCIVPTQWVMDTKKCLSDQYSAEPVAHMVQFVPKSQISETDTAVSMVIPSQMIACKGWHTNWTIIIVVHILFGSEMKNLSDNGLGRRECTLPNWSGHAPMPATMAQCQTFHIRIELLFDPTLTAVIRSSSLMISHVLVGCWLTVTSYCLLYNCTNCVQLFYCCIHDVWS